MNHPLRHLLIAACILFAGGCARHKIIPDSELALIFRDAFISNAYVGTMGVSLDSLNIYEPIFASHGYTTNDVQYTIGNFSKRKSARLGDVVEEAITLLETQGDNYLREVSILDTIDKVATRTLTRRIASDTLLRVTALRDTTRVTFSYDVEPGEYNLRLKYFVDSLDRNDRNDRNMRISVWLERRDSTRTGFYTNTLRRNFEESFIRRIITDSSHRRLHVKLLGFAGKALKPSITYRSYELDYTPTVPRAVEEFYNQKLDIRIFADEFFRQTNPTDSL